MWWERRFLYGRKVYLYTERTRVNGHLLFPLNNLPHPLSASFRVRRYKRTAVVPLKLFVIQWGHKELNKFINKEYRVSKNSLSKWEHQIVDMTFPLMIEPISFFLTHFYFFKPIRLALC